MHCEKHTEFVVRRLFVSLSVCLFVLSVFVVFTVCSVFGCLLFVYVWQNSHQSKQNQVISISANINHHF